jgi:hypothetical protein
MRVSVVAFGLVALAATVAGASPLSYTSLAGFVSAELAHFTEPVGMFMLGAGLLGAGILRRR